MTTSETLARVLHRNGLFIFNYYEFPSLIKGGHQTGQIFASTEHATCQKRHLNILIALDENGLKQHQAEISQETIIICEPNIDGYDIEQYKHLTPHIYVVPMTQIARELTGHSIATNTAALGATAYFLGIQPKFFHDMLHEQFDHKGADVVNGNIAVFDRAYEESKQVGQPLFQIEPRPQPHLLMNGGEAVGTGAIAGGLQFYSAYPMSPSSNTFHFVAAQQGEFPIVVRHAEDEIAAINLAVGASYAGVRAMTGSAGGGFALMVETVSLLGVMELPLVIMVAQRPGPATGLPTWTSQGDLQFILRSGHGEFQRIVLTPGTAWEHFEFTRLAFDWAEKYQIPVFIVTDKYILESHQTLPTPPTEYQVSRLSMVKNEELPEDNSYLRYKITENGISPRSIPGQPHGLNLTNSYEHEEWGWATEEADMTVKQVDKRARKMDTIVNELPQPQLLGPEQANVTLVCWGSTVSVVKQLIFEQTQNPTAGKTINCIYLPSVWPFPVKAFTKLAQQAKTLIMLEGNATGQAEQLIRQETGITFPYHIRRYDGRPFYVEDIVEWLQKLS